MESGRMPACDIVPFVGEDIAGVPDTREHNKQNSPSAQVRTQGNRCGHNKNQFKKPKIFSESNKRRPHCLEEAKRRIESSISDNFQFSDFTGIFYHSASDNGSGRRRRSERIEGVLSLALPALLHSVNLHKMACGYYDNRNEFHFYDYGYIEDKTNQNYSRIKREMALLQEQGIIKVHSIRKPNNDGSYRTIRVEIEFTDKIFQMLDLMPEFLKDRETSSIKFHEKQKRLDRNLAKKDIYRKPHFNSSKKKQKLESGLKTFANAIIKPCKPASKGRGMEIKNIYQRLTSQGVSPQEAAEIIRTKYPPPH